ncbi:MAG TPA: protein kinase [Polyangiaceae bacterium]|nr:protein kinase [Polyangiaceae bacterium]
MLKPGDTFERYTIEALIGQGGMGCVYRAYDPRLDRRVALKVISEGAEDPATNARLLREARAAAAFDHPNAVTIFDVGEVDGAPYIVMELVEGRTLREAPDDAPLPVATRVAQLADVARALAAAHKRGLVHRDIKPENVMVRGDGMVKVLDFGIARRTGGPTNPQSPTQPALPTLTVEGVHLGTPVYMAPEQMRGEKLDGRADQFAWGVLAFELLAQKLPWRGDDVLAVMASALTDPVDRLALEKAGVPPAVTSVVLRALEKQPAARFASMDELATALESAGVAETFGEPLKAKPAASATMAQQFSTSEVREVLAQAIERQASKQDSVKLGFEDLIDIAAEVGVDVESLREASRALRVRGQEQLTVSAEATKRDAWLRHRRLAFYRHAGIYAIVNAALLVLGLALLSFTPWWIWCLPALGWGVGVAIHGLVALTSNEEDWNEHNTAMQWWLGNQQRGLPLPRGAALTDHAGVLHHGPRVRIGVAEALPSNADELADGDAPDADADADARAGSRLRTRAERN